MIFRNGRVILLKKYDENTFPPKILMDSFFFFLKEVRNATEAHTALMRGSPYVPRTLQMQLMRINICRGFENNIPFHA